MPYFDTEITEEMAVDHNLMRTAIENETPKLPPGTRFEYHALTYGWLVDQIIRHTDEKRRGIGQFLREEITGPNGESLIQFDSRFVQIRVIFRGPFRSFS